MDMSPAPSAAFLQFEQLVYHSPFDVWIAALGAVAVFGLMVLVVSRHKPAAPEVREKWRLEPAPRDLWSKYFRGLWWAP